MSTKVSSKSAAKSATESKANAKEEVKVVAVPSQVVKEFQAAATADKAASLAIQTRDQGVVKLGKLVGETMGKEPRDAVRLALKPVAEEAYKKAGKDALYSGQQLARILSIAFPGGQKAEPAERKAATAAMERAIKENLGTQKVLGCASGRLAFDKEGELVEVKVSTRGGSNVKTPFETFTKAIQDAVTAFKTADGEPEQMINALYEAMKDCELVADFEDFQRLTVEE